MKRMSLTLIVAIMAAGAPVVQLPAQATAAKADPNHIVCKTQPRKGTRFRDKICHTRAEWDQITEENKRAASEMVTQSINRRPCDDPKELC